MLQADFESREAAGSEAVAPDAPSLTCFLYPGWRPNIRPAPVKRDWMSNSPEAFAYRCLPLNIANTHGWELLSPCTFEACWLGGTGTDQVILRLPEGLPSDLAPVSLFGQGVITFHVQGIFRTPPGWNLWVGGSPNSPKDAIQPLTGVVETDWAPFTFTMNWRFTRADHWVRFEEGEPICFFFPVLRDMVETVQPTFAEIADAPALKAQFEAWSQARNAFHQKMQTAPPQAPADRWQKHYYQGTDVEQKRGAEDHRTKLRVSGFTPPVEPRRWEAEPPPRPAERSADAALRKRDWLLDVIEAHRHLAPEAGAIDRYEGLGAEEFFERFYTQNRPVVLGGEMADWPALKLWTPEHLARTVGAAPIEYQGGRDGDAEFELHKEAHRREAPFDRFIERITRPGAGNDAYMTAYNSRKNIEALQPLRADMRPLGKLLAGDGGGMMWIGPAGTFTPLHHDLTNNLIAQVVGRKQIILSPPSETSRMRNNIHVFSDLVDIQNPVIDAADIHEIQGGRFYEVVLEPGDLLFLPIGWWHQVRALDFSVTLTYTNFRWKNDWSETYPD